VIGLLPAQAALAAGAGSVTALHKDTAGNEVSGDISMTAGDKVELGWDVVNPDGVETSYSSVNWAGGGSAPGVKGVTWSSTDGALPSGITDGSVISFSTVTFVGRIPPYAGVLYSITGLAAGTTELTITVTFDDDSTATDTITVNVASRPTPPTPISVGSIGLDHDAGDGTFVSGNFSVDVGGSIQVQVPYSAPGGVTIADTSVQYDPSVISMGPIDPATRIATVSGLQAGSTTLTVTLILSSGAHLSIGVQVTVTNPGSGSGGGPVSHYEELTVGNVTVSAVLPDTVKLEVTPLTQETDPRYDGFQVAVGNMQILGLYDIKLVDTQTGQKYELPAGDVAIVSISGFAFTGTPTVKVAHQKEDGSLEYLSNEVGGDTVVFVTSSFSLYGVVTEPAQSAPTSNDQPSQTKVKVPPLSSPGSSSLSNLPETGDTASTNMLVVGNLLLISALAVSLELTRKRKLSWQAFFLKK